MERYDENEIDLARRIMAAGEARDALAEAEFCRAVAPRIRLYGRKHLRDRVGAEDLVQEVLVLTLQRLRAGTIREPDKVLSFLFGTCRQLVVDQRRGTARRERLLAMYAADLVDAIEAPPPTFEEGGLKQCLEALAERERSIVLMTFYDDRCADDIASELGLSAGNVRIIRHRGLERLRRCVELRGGYR